MQSKRKGLFRSILALLTTLTMLLGMMPMTAFAEETFSAESSENGVVEEGGMHLKKTATLEDDGTYTINLEAWSMGETIEQTISKNQPLDIVLVLDQSGSMNEAFADGEYEKQPEKEYTFKEIEEKAYYFKDGDNYYKVYKDIYNNNYSDTYGIYYWNNGKKSLIKQNLNLGVAEDYSEAVTDSIVLYTPKEPKLDALKIAANNFVKTVAENASKDANHKIAIVGFASENDQGFNTEILSVSGANTTVNGVSVGVRYPANKEDYSQALQDVTQNNGIQVLNDAIKALEAQGATRADLGMKMANEILQTSTDPKRGKVVLMFTDGMPNGVNITSGFEDLVADDAIRNAKTIKDSGATIYTVGVFKEANTADVGNEINKYMNYVSSNYSAANSMNDSGVLAEQIPATGYYLASNNPAEFKKIFKQISEQITTDTTTVTLNEDSVMRDILSDDFEFASDFNIETDVNVSTKTINTDKTVGSDTVSLLTKSYNENSKSVSITGFDYSEKYVTSQKNGEGVFVTIKKVIPKDSAVTENSIPTNKKESGIYKGTEAASVSFRFPQPKTILTNKAYVLDYAKPVTLSSENWKMGDVNKITGTIGDKNAGYTPQYGNLDVGSLKYSPNKTNWDGYDKFYAFGKTDDQKIKEVDANQNGNLWSRVSVLPANNVYYEDDFITDKSTNVVGIEYGGDWKVVYNEVTYSNDNETTASDVSDDIHGGWKNVSLSDDTKYSDGSAHFADADTEEKENGNVATATFTFTGTGVDIYSHTTPGVGMITALLTSENKDVRKKILVMDNKSEGDYYQIPTVSFGFGNEKDILPYGTYTVKLSVSGTNKDKANEGMRRSTYYLDGIRVYNPIQDQEDDEIVIDAYGDDMLNATFQEVRDILLEQYSGNFSKGMAVFLDRTTQDAELKINTSSVSDFEKYGPKNEVYLAKGQMIAFKVNTENSAKYFVGLKALNGDTTVKFTNEENASGQSIEHSTDLYYEVKPDSDGEYAGCIVIENTGEKLLAITKIFYNNNKGNIVGTDLTVTPEPTEDSIIDNATVSVETFSDSLEFTDGAEIVSAEGVENFSAEDINMFAAEAEEISAQDNTTTEETNGIPQDPLVIQLVEYANLFDTLPEVPYEEEAVEEPVEDDAEDNNEEVKEPEEGNVEITNPEPGEEQKPIKDIYDWLKQLFHGFGKYF